MRWWALTWRIEVIDEAGIGTAGVFPEPVIFSLWHDHIFMVPPIWSKHLGGYREAVVLTSASNDGAVLEAAVGVFGIGAVRGSSSRRAVAGLLGLRQAVRNGKDTCITPDGPRGPRHECQAGIIKLAQTTGAPIIPIRCTWSCGIRLNSWDRLIIPMPFSKVCLTFGAPRFISDRIDDAALDAECRALETALGKPGKTR